MSSAKRAFTGQLRSEWTLAKVESAKEIAKAILDGVEVPLKPRARLKACLNEMKRLQQSDHSNDRLLLFVYLVSSLLHHARFGGLSEAEVLKHSNLAFQLLQMEGIVAVGSRLAFLHGYVHSALGQIFWQTGFHWNSVWEQFMALRVATVGSETKDGFHFFVMANRLFRLGELKKSMRFYEEAERAGIDEANRQKGLAMQLRASRLLGERENFAYLMDALSGTGPISDQLKRDLHWEKICFEYSSTHNLQPMLTASRRQSAMVSPIFSAELILWVHAHPTTEYISKAPSAAHLKKTLGPRPQSQRLILDICSVLQMTYDKTSNVEFRIRTLGESLQQIPRLTLIDHELLSWLAAARALFRLRLNDYTLAATCLSQYEALSRRITNGASDDVLGVARDLLDGEWYLRGL